MWNVGEIYRLETENKTLQFENFGIYEFIEFKEIQIRLFCQCVIKPLIITLFAFICCNKGNRSNLNLVIFSYIH